MRSCIQNNNRAARGRRHGPTVWYVEEPTMKPTRLAFEFDFVLLI